MIECCYFIYYGIRFENNELAEAFIRQMASEVKSRLDAIGMGGRSLVLKIMKRDPVEPTKVGPFCCILVGVAWILDIFFII